MLTFDKRDDCNTGGSGEFRRQLLGNKLLELYNIISQVFAVKTRLDYSGTKEWKLSILSLRWKRGPQQNILQLESQ
jgi:hypothetical protein